MVDSPCVKICELDRDDVCVGCGRTRAEIAGWMSMSEPQRAEVVRQAEKRKSAGDGAGRKRYRSDGSN